MTPDFLSFLRANNINYEWESGCEPMWVGNVYDMSRPFREPKLEIVQTHPDEVTLSYKARQGSEVVVGNIDDGGFFWMGQHSMNRTINRLHYGKPESLDKLRAYLVDGVEP